MTAHPPGAEPAAASAVRLAPRGRFFAAAVSALIHVVVLAGLLLWHVAPSLQDMRSALTVVDLPDEVPPEKKEEPPPPEPHKKPGEAMKDKAGAPAPKEAAAPLAKAVVPVVTPSFVPAAIPSTGTAQSTGNALAGTGTGAGGQGNGTGGGGTGGGGAGGAGEGTSPEITRGNFRPSDYPKSLREAGPRGRTWTVVTVGLNGRPLSCEVERSSGTALLDSETCRIIMERFRFRPGRDAAGKPTVAPFYIDIGWEYIDLDRK